MLKIYFIARYQMAYCLFAYNPTMSARHISDKYNITIKAQSYFKFNSSGRIGHILHCVLS